MNVEAQQLDPMLQFFAYDHLPDRLREISAPFGQLALAIVTILPPNQERTTALRKLLEAKDCAVRARLYRFPPPPSPYPPRPTAEQAVPKDTTPTATTNGPGPAAGAGQAVQDSGDAKQPQD